MVRKNISGNLFRQSVFIFNLIRLRKSEVATEGVPQKKIFLKISQYSPVLESPVLFTNNTYVGDYF